MHPDTHTMSQQHVSRHSLSIFSRCQWEKAKRLPSSMDGQLALDFHNEQMFAIDIDTDIHIYMIHDVHHDYDAQGVP